ncbi:hypothetical protein BBP40_001939, partial [Aspergillus hancockii]
EEEEEEEEPSSPPAAKATSAKRAKPDKALASRKRRKASTTESENQDESSALLDDLSEDKVKQPAKRQPKATQEKTSKTNPSDERVSDDSDSINDKEDIRPSDDAGEPKIHQKDGSESEMSVVLDEEPKPIRKRQKNASSEGTTRKGKKTTTTKAKYTKTKEADIDPDQAEIKRLQGWLIKCGIRKMWARELAPYATSKAKIKHLKEMLNEAGMDGRYSVEKAKRIKEERELKADLKMVQEGAKRWGTGGADEESDQGRPRRRLNRGRQSLAFLESDGEETD